MQTQGGHRSAQLVGDVCSELTLTGECIAHAARTIGDRSRKGVDLGGGPRLDLHARGLEDLRHRRLQIHVMLCGDQPHRLRQSGRQRRSCL